MNDSQRNATGDLGASDHPLALLRTQDSLYAKLEAMACQQRTLITGEDTAPLLALLAERQRLSSQLSILGERLRPIQRDWALHRERLPEGQRAEADRLIASTEKRLRSVIETDEQDARLLSARKAETSSTLRAVHGTSQAVGAYRVAATSSNRLDRVNEELA